MQVVDGRKVWQKNEGEYFPDWLRRVTHELVTPVPQPEEVWQGLQHAEVKVIAGQRHLSWELPSQADGLSINFYGNVTLNRDGSLDSAGGTGWFGAFKDYEKFHGRKIARSVESGDVTAKVTALEDLGEGPPGFFDASAPGGDPQPFITTVLKEEDLRRNLVAPPAPVWPDQPFGLLQGAVTTEVVVDRNGKLREHGSISSDNPAMNDAARRWFEAVQFRPFVVDGRPAQVEGRLTLAYHARRPAGMDDLGTAHDLFERGRAAGFGCAAGRPAYRLTGTFEFRNAKGELAKGEYTDTCQDPAHWRREARVEGSRFVRSQDCAKRFLFSDGSDARLLALVLKITEPIPALDTFWEGDWRLSRVSCGEIRCVRAAVGPEGADGELKLAQARGFWFADNGDLLRAVTGCVDVRRSNFAGSGGVRVAQNLLVRTAAGGVAMKVTLAPPEPLTATIDPRLFQEKGHEWTRQFTDEVR